GKPDCAIRSGIDVVRSSARQHRKGLYHHFAVSGAARDRQRHCSYENNAKLDHWNPPAAVTHRNYAARPAGEASLDTNTNETRAQIWLSSCRTGAVRCPNIHLAAVEYRLRLSRARSGVTSPDRA